VHAPQSASSRKKTGNFRLGEEKGDIDGAGENTTIDPRDLKMSPWRCTFQVEKRSGKKGLQGIERI